MNFTTEENVSQPELIDINTIVPPKKRGRPKKSTEASKKSTGNSGSVDFLEKLVSEKDKLKAELLRLSDYNPEIITKPINDKFAKLVEEMDVEELRERVRHGKRNQSSKMDGTVSAQVIAMANQLVGRLLGCLEELQESSMKDKLLNECVKDYLCLNILDYIPNELKISGLYGSHVVSSYTEASKKIKPAPLVLKSQDSEKIKEAINAPDFKEKMEALRNKIAGITEVKD